MVRFKQLRNNILKPKKIFQKLSLIAMLLTVGSGFEFATSGAVAGEIPAKKLPRRIAPVLIQPVLPTSSRSAPISAKWTSILANLRSAFLYKTTVDIKQNWCFSQNYLRSERSDTYLSFLDGYSSSPHWLYCEISLIKNRVLVIV